MCGFDSEEEEDSSNLVTVKTSTKNLKADYYYKRSPYAPLRKIVKYNALRCLSDKSLARYSSISMDWDQSIKSLLLALHQSYFVQYDGWLPTFVTLNHDADGVPSPSLGFLPGVLNLWSSSNGLLLCQSFNDNGSSYICKPATKEWRELSHPNKRNVLHIAKSGAIAAILKILQCQNESLLELPLAALLTLSSSSENKPEIALSGVVSHQAKLGIISTLHNLSSYQLISSLVHSGGLVSLIQLIYTSEKSAYLAEKPMSLLESFNSLSNLGFEPAIFVAFEPSMLNMSANYQLICAVPSFGEQIVCFELYSAKTNIWSQSNTICLDLGDDTEFTGNGFHMTGMAYWQTTSKQILDFDMKKESYKTISLPPKNTMHTTG